LTTHPRLLRELVLLAIRLHCELAKAQQPKPKTRVVLDMIREADGSIRWERHEHSHWALLILGVATDSVKTIIPPPIRDRSDFRAQRTTVASNESVPPLTRHPG
jgi:hypothetical protein